MNGFSFNLARRRARASRLALGLALLAAMTARAEPGVLTIQADVELASTAVLEIELTGLNPGVQFDRLEVEGDLTVDGELRLALSDNYFPVASDSFVVVLAETLTGTFANEADGRVTLADGTGSMAVSYGPATVTLSDFLSFTVLFRDGFENE